MATATAVEYFEAIPDELLTSLKAKSRPRGLYAEELGNFLDQNIPGAKVNLEVGPFAGKKAASVKSSFTNALAADKKKPEEEQRFQNVVVREDDDNVYLLRTDM